MHINRLVNKCRYFLYIFRKSSYLLTNVLEIMYYGYIHSILNYGITIWAGAYPTALNRLNSIQDKFIKFLIKIDFEHDCARPTKLKPTLLCFKIYYNFILKTCRHRFFSSFQTFLSSLGSH